MMYRSRGPSTRIKLWLRMHRRTLRRLELIAIVCSGLLYLTQIFYPGQRMLPFVRLAGQRVGGQSVASAARQVDQRLGATQFTIATEDDTLSATFADMGAMPKTTEAAHAAADYPFLQRLIPFSSLYVMATRNQGVRATYTTEQLTAFAVRTEANTARGAVDATAKIVDHKAVLVPTVPAKQYVAADTIASLQHAAFTVDGTVHLRPHNAAAARTNAAVQPVVDAANKAIDNTPVFTIDGKKIHPKGAEVAAWLSFSSDTSNQLQITVKTSAIASYLIHVEGDDYKAPGKTHVKLIDDYEVDRQTGPSGRGVDPAKAAADLQAGIRSGKAQTLAFTLGDLPPEIVNDRTTSNSDAAFGNLLEHIATSKGGFGLAAIQMNGKAGKANGDKQFIAASTYKLYVSYVWFKQVAAGDASWDENIGGVSADSCFTRMIVNSDNDCAVAFATRVGGWTLINTTMKDIGLKNTTLKPGNLKTTASDLAYFMYRLENKTLVKDADRSRLISLMERQVYRDGIPAGTGEKTADKVGFVDGYFNDAGIVYTQKGTYVLVIMSYGSNWAQVADAAGQINDYLTK